MGKARGKYTNLEAAELKEMEQMTQMRVTERLRAQTAEGKPPPQEAASLSGYPSWDPSRRPPAPVTQVTAAPSEPVLGVGFGSVQGAGTPSVFKPPKEASQIELPPMPTPVGFRHWRTALREVVAAAASDPQQAFAWVKEVENSKIAYASLGDSQGFVTLDAKLAAASGCCIKRSGSSPREVAKRTPIAL